VPEGRDRVTAQVHPIEAESYRIMAGRVDLSNVDPGRRAVIQRVIHASADLEYASTMRFDDDAVDAAVGALAAGAPVVTDVEMVRAGIPGAVCFLPEEAGDASTRSAGGIRLAARRYRAGAIVVVGCAPTALVEAVECDWEPAAIVGLPVGFVGAAESKALARSSRHRTITNVGEKGGSAVAAAAVNALRRLANAR
jgi:precorrin-8X/cobalt-precorrin-8 methylmutase